MSRSRIICNKLIGQCGNVEWDGKGKKPPFWNDEEDNGFVVNFYL